MIGDTLVLTDFHKKNLEELHFCANNKGKIIGYGKVGKHKIDSIDEIYLFDGLKYKLLGISPLCDKSNKVCFNSS